MLQQYNELLHKAYKKWGKIPQILMALEEMAELSKELLKNINRNALNEQEIKEEIGDVYILLEQLKIIYDISDQELSELMEKKLIKLKNLINE